MSGYRLGPAAKAAGHRLHVHESLGSTNTQAMELARQGERGPLWVVALRQEAGRGRRGSTWASLPGNLTASLLWPVSDVDPVQVPSLGFVAGVALIAALKRTIKLPLHPEAPERKGGFAGGLQFSRDPREPSCEAAGAAPQDEIDCLRSGGISPFRLKWPNDVLVSGAKLAGLLLEAETHPGGRRSAVIGFGVNVAASPQDLPYPATSLSQSSYETRAEDLFDYLSDEIVAAARLWSRGGGFSTIRRLWLDDAAGIGAPVSVRIGGEIVQGIFETIDEAGRLVVRSDDGTRRTVTAGEVHLGSAATAA
ncbi:biotin--[acetyl-CoA-carboxylase] ligase [Methylobacterium bullatum]|uniref:biotin--[biotin carboxyl-carrier protein] ligase n=1 Tax=Methylobacterium bullatum TaxID=570505 RepID=A0AAV4Z3K8_9HYPH|nr:biotin--[acetyl-CoA-carboxylase] ligase [Methylobacterium bullatum]MBD8902852.1 biotin--[acetyl-CoA-carboxylase] ligase [Methylobacterium bullatum]GJD38382.1 Bifunctional ligase/repressor BirA [Methylobacterium bullatum]